MSEITTSNAVSVYPSFGIQVIASSPVILRKSSNVTRNVSAIEAIGGPADDIIRPLDSKVLTPFDVSGGAGKDFLIGGAGDDVISGGTGNDRIEGNAGNDTLNGDEGDDVIEGGDGNDIINGGDGNDTINGGTGNDTISGGAGNDFITGGDGDDNIAGDDGDDTIFGGRGKDTISGGIGNDVIFGNQDNDDISGGDGDDLLRGDIGNDKIDGDEGDDRIFGGQGNDLMIGGAGEDTLTGGAGKDIFVINADDAVDTIEDFKAKDDKIRLDQSLLPGSGLRIGGLKPSDFQVVKTSKTATAKVFYEQRTGMVYYNPPGRGANVPLVQMDRGLSGLSASNFEIIEG